jgi:hypothetical protein
MLDHQVNDFGVCRKNTKIQNSKSMLTATDGQAKNLTPINLHFRGHTNMYAISSPIHV